jgi:hypothetical protein
VPNLLTQVPDRPVPVLPWPGRLLLPIADLFMVLMISRPPSGSLRTTWVTPATLGLSMATAVVGVLLDVAVLGGGTGDITIASLLGATVLTVLAIGSASVAAIGILQRC